MNEARADSPALAPALSGKGWPWRKLIFFIALALIVHVALITAFGTKKQIAPRDVKNAPHIQLTESANELVALGNPALFALPNPLDFASSIWLKTPVIPPPSFRYTEELRYLPPDTESLGAIFKNFMQTNYTGRFQFNSKPEPQWASPVSPIESALPQNSTLQIFGELAQRKLLSQPTLPSLEINDVIAPSKVRVLVDKSGNVISAVPLPSENPLEVLGRAEIGDTNALAFARSLRFAPAAQVAFGEVIFNWHTVPLVSTNAP